MLKPVIEKALITKKLAIKNSMNVCLINFVINTMQDEIIN